MYSSFAYTSQYYNYYCMNKTISSNSSQEQQNCIYGLLPEARPLHSKTVVQPKSVYQFIGEPAPEGIAFNMGAGEEVQQMMEEIPGDRNIGVHQIGGSFRELFRELVYQSYQEVLITEDNYKFATCTFPPDSKQTLTNTPPKQLDETHLLFQSRFQSGNLAFSSRSPTNPNEYNLALQRDTNSLATCQWYYFYIENRSNIGKYSFNVVNLVKGYSAYQNGMQPCVLSVEGGGGWRRGGDGIGYMRNSVAYRGERCYYSLRWSYNFTHKNDRVYFAYSFPYTFTRLQNFLCQIQSTHPSLVQVKQLTKTFKDNPVNIISITNPSSHTNLHGHGNIQGFNENQQQKIKKDLIMICARVHPGETNGSFACEGFIRFLISDCEEAINLRTFYLIKIVPFLNPDGVIHGNYRTSLAGQDLNRKWKKPQKSLHPQIFALKKYLTQTSHKKALFIDLHGHSKKRSSFMYGCLNKESPYMCKQFPFILSKHAYHFCYFNCNFSTPVSREGTSRMAVWKEFRVDHSYTMEISFCGPVGSRIQFMARDYGKMGEELGKVMSPYFCGKIQSRNQVEPTGIHLLLKQLYQEQQLLLQGLQQSSGSESGEEQKVQQQIDKKQQRIVVINNKESTTELNSLLTKYLADTKTKWAKREGVKSRNVKNEEKSQPNLRVRRELAPSRISIQKIDLSQQANNSYMNFGFVRGSIRITSRELRNNSIKESIKGMNHRNSYGPYSSNKTKTNSKIGQQHSLMLPKVLRQQQLKYRKYRKNQCRFEISLSHEQQPLKQGSRLGNYPTTRQISLAQKIFQSTHRQLQESGRYWVRNS